MRRLENDVSALDGGAAHDSLVVLLRFLHRAKVQKASNVATKKVNVDKGSLNKGSGQLRFPGSVVAQRCQELMQAGFKPTFSNM